MDGRAPSLWCRATTDQSLVSSLSRGSGQKELPYATADSVGLMTMLTLNGSTALSRQSALGTIGTGAYRSRPSTPSWPLGLRITTMSEYT